VKNDLVGLRVFMDRFLVYLQIPLIVLGGLGAAKAAGWAREAGERADQILAAAKRGRR